MSVTRKLTDDLHPDIEDLEDLILDGYLDEFEALEEFQDAVDARFAKAALPALDTNPIRIPIEWTRGLPVT